MSWYSSIPSLAMLDMWIKNNYNVLFHGRPGVGKTSMVFEAFEKQGWEKNVDYLYFSAATIDPWVDLIGVPSKSTNDDGEEVLRLVRPDTIKNKTIKAFFVDELNRSHKKVRNALMELIQFKSINGMRFPNLEIIWAAVNPADDEEMKFDVEKLDLAQEDRFQIQVHIPYKPNEAYFAQKFNDPDMAEAVCKWWSDQPEKVKQQLTPRRLEYAIDVFMKTDDLRFVVPSEAHISSLKSAIQCGNPEKTLLKMIEKDDVAEIRKWLAVENNLASVQNLICTNRDVCKKVLHLLSDERVVSLASKHKTIVDQIRNEPSKYERIIRDVASCTTNKKLQETFTSLVASLDKNINILQKMSLPVKPIKNISPRRRTQMISNYRIDDSLEVVCVNNPVRKISDDLTAILSECSFIKGSVRAIEALEDLGSIVYPNMGKIEATASLKILNFLFTDHVTVDNEQFATKYLPIINSCVLSLLRNETNITTEMLMDLVPQLYVRVLVYAADNTEALGIENSNIVLQKHSNEMFAELSDEIEKPVSQNLADLF